MMPLPGGDGARRVDDRVSRRALQPRLQAAVDFDGHRQVATGAEASVIL